MSVDKSKCLRWHLITLTQNMGHLLLARRGDAAALYFSSLQLLEQFFFPEKAECTPFLGGTLHIFFPQAAPDHNFLLQQGETWQGFSQKPVRVDHFLCPDGVHSSRSAKHLFPMELQMPFQPNSEAFFSSLYIDGSRCLRRCNHSVSQLFSFSSFPFPGTTWNSFLSVAVLLPNSEQ